MKFSSILVISFLLVGTCLGRQRKGSLDNEDKGNGQERDGKSTYLSFTYMKCYFTFAYR